MARFLSTISHCDTTGREDQTAVADLDGAVLVSGSSSFPYFFLVAVEAGSFLRGALLLLLYPLVSFLRRFVSYSLATQMMIFVSTSGLKLRDIQLVSKAVLPRFYAGEVREDAWRVLGACRKRVLVSSYPTVMVEAFARDLLAADAVIGTEIEVDCRTGRATGFVKSPGVVAGELKAFASERALGGEVADVAIGDAESGHYFAGISKECYFVNSEPGAPAAADVVPEHHLNKPIIFHDGRLVGRPTPMNALKVYLWLPLGFLLALLRVHLYFFLPYHLVLPVYRLLGVDINIHGAPPPPPSPETPGSLLVCNHRTLLDAVIIHVALQRRVSAVTYSLGRLSELLSPIPLARLTRDRATDKKLIAAFLDHGDLIVCPEGTTCRGPYLLRFSPLFAELSDRVVPVAVRCEQSMFYGNTARGCKSMDVYFFFMNPRVRYDVTFMDGLPRDRTCMGGASAVHVANHVQRLLGGALGFECTMLTRRDKYLVLSGNDGKVQGATPNSSAIKMPVVVL